MYTKTGRECNLMKRIYRNGTKQNMSKHTCLFQARSAACPFILCRGFFTPKIGPVPPKLQGLSICRGTKLRKKQQLYPQFQNSVGTLDLDDHWSYKWLFLSEELWMDLFVDVRVIVGEHCLTFFSFQFQYKKTRIIMPRAYSELSKSLSCLSDNRSGRCGQGVRPIKHLPDLHIFYNLTELHIYWLNP